jgi:hypothetical protein
MLFLHPNFGGFGLIRVIADGSIMTAFGVPWSLHPSMKVVKNIDFAEGTNGTCIAVTNYIQPCYLRPSWRADHIPKE